MRRSIVLAALFSLAVTACGDDGEPEGSNGAEGLGKLNVGITGQSADLMLPTVAQELGCYEEGLEVEIFVFGGGPDGARALLNGDADIVSSALTSPAVAQDSGQDMVVFYGGNTSQFSWWAKPEITSLDQLEGASVIVNPLGSTPHLVTVYMLDQLTSFGSEGVEFVPVSGSGARLSSLLAGQGDAAILAQAEAYEAEAQGYVRLAGLEDLPAANPNSYNAMRSLLDERPEAVQAFIDGIECAVDAWDNDPDSVVPIVAEFTGYETELAQRFVTESKGRDPECGEIREQDAQLVIEMLRGSGDITGDVAPEDYIDDRFIGC